MKQTAVNWMANELLYLDNEFDMKLIDKNEYQARRKEVIEQAKEMEMNQLEKFYNHGMWAIIEHGHGDEFIDYFDKTFKSE